MTAMKYRILGSSGLRVSEICLGTMTFGGGHAGAMVDIDDARSIIDLYREAGGNFLDTANIYSMGESETLVGEIIKPYRSQIVLATKYGMSMDHSDPNAGGMHRKNLFQSVEQSLKRLQTDYIDLYWIHAWDRLTPTDELLSALDDLVRSGKVLHIGASNTPAWRVAEANSKASLRTQTPLSAVQVQYSLAERSIEADTTPMAEALNVSIVAWSPLCGGLLTGKYLNEDGGNGGGNDGKEGRLKTTNFGGGLLTERNVEIAKLVVDIAAELGVTPSQLAIAWLLHKKAIPIIGGTKQGHFEEAINAVDIELSSEILGILDEATKPHAVQPSSLFPRINAMVYGNSAERLL